MNKENAIRKIQQGGRFGALAAKVLLVLISIGFVALLAGTVAIFALPKELQQLSIDVESKVHVLLPDVDSWLSQTLVRHGQDLDLVVTQNGFAPDPETTVELRDDGLHVESVAQGQHFTLGQLRIVLPVALLYLLLTGLSLWFVKALCKALATCQSPFDPLVIRRIQQLAYSLLPWTLAGLLAQLATSLLYRSGITFSLNLNSVFVALLLLGLALIFKYGAILQQESDETL